MKVAYFKGGEGDLSLLFNKRGLIFLLLLSIMFTGCDAHLREENLEERVFCKLNRIIRMEPKLLNREQECLFMTGGQ